jgi:hypothetical protein
MGGILKERALLSCVATFVIIPKVDFDGSLSVQLKPKG